MYKHRELQLLIKNDIIGTNNYNEVAAGLKGVSAFRKLSSPCLGLYLKKQETAEKKTVCGYTPFSQYEYMCLGH